MEPSKKPAASTGTGSSTTATYDNDGSAPVAMAFSEPIAEDDPRTGALPWAKAEQTTSAAATTSATATAAPNVASADGSVVQWVHEYDDDMTRKLRDEDQVQGCDTAVAVPLAYDTPNTTDADRHAARLGTGRGRQHAQREVQDLVRQNRDIPVRNFAERQEIVELATPRGLVQNYREERGLTQTSATMPKLPPYVPKPPPKEPDFFPGTYGKEYQTKEYDTSNYDTTDYDGAPYKSVYE